MVNVGGGLADGNINRQTYHADANVMVRGRDDKVTFGGFYNYADDDDELSARNLQLFGNYAHFFTDKWYGYANGLFTNDRFQDIQLRSAFGAGAGYQFFESEDLNLGFEAGPAYVNTDFYDYSLVWDQAGCEAGTVPKDQCDLDDRSGIAGRWALNYDQMILNRIVQLFHHHEGLVNEDLFIRTGTGFHVPVWNGLQFTNEVQVDYFNNPAFGKKTADTRYVFTFGYG